MALVLLSLMACPPTCRWGVVQTLHVLHGASHVMHCHEIHTVWSSHFLKPLSHTHLGPLTHPVVVAGHVLGQLQASPLCIVLLCTGVRCHKDLCRAAQGL